MLQTTTAKFQIIVSEQDKSALDETMAVYRDACNYVSGYIFDTHDLKQASLNTHLYRPLREQFGLKSQMAQSVLKTVIARYKAVLEQEHKWIQSVFRKPCYDLVWNRDYSLNNHQFSVNTLHGRLKFDYHDEQMRQYFDADTYKFGTAKLIHKHNRYFLHISVTREIDDCDMSDICNVVGIDRGINFVVATYDSHAHSEFVSGREIKQKRANYVKLRKELQMRHTPSARRRLKAVGQRENRWMQDINHCVSKALVENNPKHTLFVLEDLTGIRSATERVKLKHRYVSVSWAFYDLELKLTYKAKRNQCAVIKVNPAYTSQACPKCGHTEKANRDKKKHVFKCKCCGYTSNDDRIGAMNLHRMGINYLVPDAVTVE